MTKTSTAIKLTPAMITALNKLADKTGSGLVPMRRSTSSALHDRGLMKFGEITPAGLAAIGR